ncbi:MAG: hypothetical protein QOG99_3843 [Frankiales bacterium]|jgi:uncharacterized protein YndB with AHSA1/START domain|nr:hypothetical protein [Frankiales bacterium]
MTLNTSPVNEERGYTIQRTFDAPQDLVWTCLTQPEHFAVWYGGHDGQMKDMVCDARVGGAWGGTMVLPNGVEMAWLGEFREVDPTSHLVLAFTVPDEFPEGTPFEYDLFHFDLAEADGKTELTLRQSGGHLTDEQYVGAEHGTGTFIDVLAEHLAALQG